MYKSIFLNQHWVSILTLQIILVMALLSTNLKAVNAKAAIENELLMPDDVYTSWNKRFSPDPAAMEKSMNNVNDAIIDGNISNEESDGGSSNPHLLYLRKRDKKSPKHFTTTLSKIDQWNRLKILYLGK